MNKYILIWTFLVIASCSPKNTLLVEQTDYNQAEIIERNSNHEKSRMRYKLVQSKVLDKSKLQKSILKQIKDFKQEDYDRLSPYIYEQDIRSIQKSIQAGNLTYKRLVQWYLYRINKYEIDPNTSLHTVIAINPKAVEEAEQRDSRRGPLQHPIFGMPILLKDNIDAAGMPTTAGAIALEKNMKADAFIVKQMKTKGAIILGKVNLSEWAYFFCSGCPVGYSAIGGQTLNPYGRTIFETGGSSAGSGTAVAANYAVGAIGTETSGSILSPSSQNSIVGLKPTVGLLSRSGIVPISSTLDTPGPMTKNVRDNAILLSAMIGIDEADEYTQISKNEGDYEEKIASIPLEGVRIGVNKDYMDNIPQYSQMMVQLVKSGAVVFGFEPKEIRLKGFRTILNIDMKNDLPKYLISSPDAKVKSVKDVVSFNEKEMDIRAPYGQALFEGIIQDSTSLDEVDEIIASGREVARSYFDEPIKEFDLDVFTSINNYDAGKAALAHYPALTIPMGYKENGEPINLTLISTTLSEEKLLKIAYTIEQETMLRKAPNFE